MIETERKSLKGKYLKHLEGWGEIANPLIDTELHHASFRRNDLQLLEALLSGVQHRKTRRSISQRLLEKFGDIRSILFSPVHDLACVEGLNGKGIQRLTIAGQLLDAILRSELADKPVLRNLDEVLIYCKALLAGKLREQFHCLFMDKSMRLIARECLQIGTIDHVTIYPRELMSRSLHHGATSIILVHNHPSANANPSRSDIKMTRRLIEIGNFLGISIADHIIVSRKEVFSFKKAEMI